MDPVVGRLAGLLGGFAVWYVFVAPVLHETNQVLMLGMLVALPVFAFLWGGWVELWIRSRRRGSPTIQPAGTASRTAAQAVPRSPVADRSMNDRPAMPSLRVAGIAIAAVVAVLYVVTGEPEFGKGSGVASGSALWIAMGVLAFMAYYVLYSMVVYQTFPAIGGCFSTLTCIGAVVAVVAAVMLLV